MTLRQFVRDLIPFLIIGFLLRWATGVPFLHLPGEAIIDIAIAVTSSLIILSWRLFHLWAIIRRLLAFFEHTESRFRKPAIEFLRNGVNALSEKIPSLFGKDGLELSVLETDLISQLCFQFGQGVYNGTDSNVPSVFKSKYPQYLSYQEENLKKKSAEGIRILLVTESDLQTDFSCNKQEFKSFLKWHNDNCIDLLQVDPTNAIRLAKKHYIPTSATDIGIWDADYAGIFKSHSRTIRLMIRPATSTEFENCKRYFIDLLSGTKDITIVSDTLKLGERSEKQKELDIERVNKQWTK